jgi:hypothetical protein
MLFYYSENVRLYFFRKSSLLELNWCENSREMTGKEFIQEVNTFMEYVELFKPKKIIINLEKLYFHIPFRLIPLIRNKIHLLNKWGVDKLAFIESDDPISRIIMNDLIHMAHFIKFTLDIYDNEQKALQWLSKQTEHQTENDIYKVA